MYAFVITRPMMLVRARLTAKFDQNCLELMGGIKSFAKNTINALKMLIFKKMQRSLNY